MHVIPKVAAKTKLFENTKQIVILAKVTEHVHMKNTTILQCRLSVIPLNPKKQNLPDPSVKFLGNGNFSWFWFKCSRPAFNGDVCDKRTQKSERFPVRNHIIEYWETLLGQTTTESAKKERSKLQVLMNCLICLDVKVVDILYLDIDCDGKCSKTSRVPCKVEFQGMGWEGDVDVEV